jgi:hypothetical protein
MKPGTLVLVSLVVLAVASQATASEMWLLVQVDATGRVLSNLGAFSSKESCVAELAKEKAAGMKGLECRPLASSPATPPSPQQPVIRVEGCYVNHVNKTIYVAVNSNTGGKVTVNLAVGVQYVSAFEQRSAFEFVFNVNSGRRNVVVREALLQGAYFQEDITKRIAQWIADDGQHLLRCLVSSATTTPYDTANLLRRHREVGPWTLFAGIIPMGQYQTFDACLSALQAKTGEYVITERGAEQMTYTTPFFVCQ